jgi:hypothetical protein
MQHQQYNPHHNTAYFMPIDKCPTTTTTTRIDNGAGGTIPEIQLPIGLHLELNDEELLNAFESMMARRTTTNSALHMQIPSVLSTYNNYGLSTITSSPSVEILPKST